MKIKGDYSDKAVWINGLLITPTDTISVPMFSPMFDWGYTTNGAEQLALSILKAAGAPEDEMIRFCAELKINFVANLTRGDFEVDFDVARWLELQRARLLAS